MSKTARLYRDTRTASATSSNLDQLNGELQDVTRIMTKNMEELLWRGDSLDSESLKSVCLFPFADVSRRNVSPVHLVTE
jgi:vesicle transport protein SEC22